MKPYTKKTKPDEEESKETQKPEEGHFTEIDYTDPEWGQPVITGRKDLK